MADAGWVYQLHQARHRSRVEPTRSGESPQHGRRSDAQSPSPCHAGELSLPSLISVLRYTPVHAFMGVTCIIHIAVLQNDHLLDPSYRAYLPVSTSSRFPPPPSWPYLILNYVSSVTAMCSPLVALHCTSWGTPQSLLILRRRWRCAATTPAAEA